MIYYLVPEPRNISSPDEYSPVHSSVNRWIYVTVYSSVNRWKYWVTDAFKIFVPAHYFSLPACHIVHFDFDSVFRSAPPPPLLPTPPPTPAPAHPPRRHPHHQSATSGIDPHATRCRCPWPRPTLHSPHPHRCPRPWHPPPRKPPPPTPNASNPTPLLDVAATVSLSGEGELTKIHRFATFAITSVGSIVKFIQF
jgi:hypothetical protein